MPGKKKWQKGKKGDSTSHYEEGLLDDLGDQELFFEDAQWAAAAPAPSGAQGRRRSWLSPKFLRKKLGHSAGIATIPTLINEAGDTEPGEDRVDEPRIASARVYEGDESDPSREKSGASAASSTELEQPEFARAPSSPGPLGGITIKEQRRILATKGKAQGEGPVSGGSDYKDPELVYAVPSLARRVDPAGPPTACSSDGELEEPSLARDSRPRSPAGVAVNPAAKREAAERSDSGSSK